MEIDNLNGVNELESKVHQEEAEAWPENWLVERDKKLIKEAMFTETPPFPRVMLVEIANYCNHRCNFCAFPKMTRPKNFIDPELFKRTAQEAFDLGLREIGLHGGAEPLTNKSLDEHIATCEKIGYTYIYLTTNGTLAKHDRLKKIIDAGLNSIKFSINAGDRETYQKIHGRDHFDIALANLSYVNEYRKELDRPLFIGASFVETPENAHTYPKFLENVEGLVDEVYHVVASNQSGQMENLPVEPTMPDTCVIPFNQVTITSEGYLRMCCNDYQNFLVVEDLSLMSLERAWNGDRARELRRRHMSKQLEGTLCHNCINGCRDPIKPLNEKLCSFPAI